MSSINDLLASLSDSAVQLQSTLSPSVASEVLRQREEQRKKIATIADHLKKVVEPSDVVTSLNGVFINSSQPVLPPHVPPSASPSSLHRSHRLPSPLSVTEPSFFIDLSYRLVTSDGLAFICEWFESAFSAFQRDSGQSTSSSSSSSSSSPHTALIPPTLTAELLHLLLRAWYRVSVYQQERSRAALASRPHLFPMLRALVDHPNSEISELAVGLLVLYQPETAAEVQGLVRPSSTPSDPLAVTATGPGGSVTAQIRAEFELAKAAEEAVQQLIDAEQKVKPVKPAKAKKSSSSATNGSGSSSASPSSPPIASPVPTKATVDGGSVSGSSSALHSPSISAATPPQSAQSPSPIPASPHSPPPTYTAAYASLSCPICGETFNTDLATYHHVSNVHYVSLCTLCCLCFPTEELLYEHFEQHNHAQDMADAPHACGLCGVSFHTEDALTLHHTIHTIDRKPKAQFNARKKRKPTTADDRGSPSKKSKKAEEDDDGGGDDDDAGGNNRFPPAICNHPGHPSPLVFASDEDLQSHSITAHLYLHCFSPECELTFAKAEALADHLVKAHVLTSKDYSAGGPVPPHCPYCGMIWTKKTPRTEHLHRHEKPFTCVICGMRLARRTRWRNHAKRKHPEEFKRHSALFEGARGAA